MSPLNHTVMKTIKFSIIFFMTLILFSSQAQFTFSVSTGVIGFNAASFGKNFNNKAVAFVGLQYISASYNFEEPGFTSEFKGSLIVPNLGLKYFIKRKEKIAAFLQLNLTKPLITGESSTDGVNNPDFKKGIKSMKMWGYELGFGVEYSFDPSFSVGGEFGLRHGKFSTENSQFNSTTKIAISPTFSRVNLNFYF